MMREEKMKSTGEKMTGMRVIRKLLREKAQEALVMATLIPLFSLKCGLLMTSSR